MSRGLILLAHGSRRKESQQELLALAKELEMKLELPVVRANLEFAQPDFKQALKELIEKVDDLEEVMIMPLFIFAGKHINVDLKELIKRVKNEYPKLKFKNLGYLASKNDFADLLIRRIKNK